MTMHHEPHPSEEAPGSHTLPRATSVPKQSAGRMERIARYAVLQGARRRALFALGGLSAGDFFVPALPTQTSVIALGLMQPARWIWIATVFASASAVGVLMLAAVLALVSGYAQQFGPEQMGDAWTTVMDRLRQWGIWAVFFFSIFPTPPRLLTAATLLSGGGALAVSAAVFAGRMIWLLGFLLLLTRAPQWLARVPLLGAALRRFEAFRAQVLADAQREVSPHSHRPQPGVAP